MRASSEAHLAHPELAGFTAGLYAVVATALVLCAAPTVGFRDAGELGSSMFHLGIAHPTGFPLVMLLGKAAALVPLGDAALRLNAASALALAGAATLVARLVVEAAAERPAGRAVPLLAAAAAIAPLVCGPSFSWFATSIEVYAASCLLVAAALLLALRAVRFGDPRYTLSTFLVAGLAAGAHVVALAGCLAAAAASFHPVLRSRARLLHCPAMLGCGAAVLLYLPVRSLAGPAVMWDDLGSLPALAAHLGGLRIREAFAGRAGGGALGHDAWALGRLVASEAGLVAFVVGPAGVLLAPRRIRPVAACLLAVAVLDLLYALLANPMGIADRQVGWLLVLSLCAATGLGLSRLLERLQARGGWLALALGAVLVLGAVGGRPVFPPRPPRDPLPLLWSESTLDDVRPRAIVLCVSDDLCGLSVWSRFVHGRRPDVGVVPRQHLWNDRSVTQGLRGSHPGAWRALLDAIGQSRRLALAGTLARERPLYWEVGDGADLEAAFGPGPPPFSHGPDARPPLARVGPGRTTRAVLVSHESRILDWLRLSGHPPRVAAASLHFTARRTLARDLLCAGLVLAWQGETAAAYEAFLHSTAIKADYSPSLTNLAVLEARAGNLRRAIFFARRAVEADPLRAKPRRVLSRLLLRAGRPEEARRVLDHEERGGRR
jgi:hypothetical protein